MGCGGSTEATGPVSALQSIPPASKEPKSGSSTPRSKNKSKAAAEAPLVGRTDARIGALLKDVPLLQNFSEKDLNLLGGAMQKEYFKVGESVFKQGDVGDRFYIIVSGSANVVMKDKNSGENRDVGFLTQGDYFGETALQHDQPRGAAIVAQIALELLSLSKEKFQKLIGTGHHVHFVNRRIGISAEAGGKKEGQERADPDAIDTHLAPPNAVREKSEEVHQLIYDTVSDSLLFTGMSEEHIQAIIGHMYRQEVEAGASPVRQGTHAYTPTHPRTRTQTHTHIQTCTHIYTHIHTHTHTHTQGTRGATSSWWSKASSSASWKGWKSQWPPAGRATSLESWH
jgi:hypothetical protein